MSKRKNELCLLMTLGMTVFKWRDIGSIERELRPYVYLYKRYGIFTEVYDFSSNAAWIGQEKFSNKLNSDGIKVVPLYGIYDGNNRILKYAHALYNFVNIIRKKEKVIIKTNQTKGSHLAVLLKITKANVFILHRSGYNYRMFTKMMFGFGPRYIFSVLETYFANYVSDRIHVSTKTELDRLPKRFINKASLLPNWSEKHSSIVKKREQYLFVGRLVEQKNIIPLLLNFPIGVDLIIVGDGPLRKKSREIIQSRGLSVKLYEKMEHERLLKLMKQSKALICCSKYEGNPKVVIEAIVNSVPVILKNSIGLSDLFPDNSLGLKFDDFEELEDCLSSLNDFEISKEVQAIFQTRHSLDYLLDVEIDLINNFYMTQFYNGAPFDKTYN